MASAAKRAALVGAPLPARKRATGEMSAAEYCAQNAIVVTKPDVSASRGGQLSSVVLPRVRTTEWPPAQTFDASPFTGKLLLGLQAARFARPSPIQAQCWPIASAGHDVVAVAKTGSGKTLSFLLPIFQRSTAPGVRRPRKGDSPFAIVMAPTRELAVQIHEQAATFGGEAGVTSMCIYGGASRAEQLPGLKAGPVLVVATPGRLVDFMTERPIGIKVEGVQVFVLDEADRMLEMGFAPSLLAVANRLPRERQTLMFSATWPKKVQELAAGLMRRSDSVHVMLGGADNQLAANQAITQHIHQCVTHSDHHEAAFLACLDDILEDITKNAIVFVNRKTTADELGQKFSARSVLWAVETLHGDKTQAERTLSLSRFANGTSRLLVATDVAARGLDVAGVNVVLNYDFPSAGQKDRTKGVETYVHRIGRCGRAGMTGVAHSFFDTAQDGRYARPLCKLLKAANQHRPTWLRKLALENNGSVGLAQLSKVQKEKERLARMMHQQREGSNFGGVSVSKQALEAELDGEDLFSRGQNSHAPGVGPDDGQREMDAVRRRQERTVENPNAGWRENGKGRH